MIRVSQNLLRALEASMDKGWFKYGELAKELGGDNEAFYTLLEGYSLGLFNIRGEDTFEIRREGLEILNAWISAGRPPQDPWIDSRIYTMLRDSRSSGRVPGEWAGLLEERGLSRSGVLSDAALQLLALVDRLDRGLVITKSMARDLAKAPDGPSSKDTYGRFLPVYEAMGIVVGSIPANHYYSLTYSGRLLKRIMARINLDAPWPSVVNRRIIEILEKASQGGELEPEEKTYVGTIGYLKPTGDIDYPGRMLLKAYKYIRKPVYSPPMALSRIEERLLKTLAELWREKEERKPNILVNVDRIREKYRELWGEEPKDVTLDLLHLESLGLVIEAEEDGKTVYKLTEEGWTLSKLPGIGKGAPVLAVKSISNPMSHLAPPIGWIQEAMEHDIVGTGGPTRRGEMLARASRITRTLLVTRVEAMVIQRIPDNASISIEDLKSGIPRDVGDPLKPLNRLEARGLVETLSDGTIRLTRPGQLVKLALLAAPPGIAVPISPVLVRVVRAVRDYGTEDIATLVNRLRLPLDTVRDAIILARSSKLIGKGGGLTSGGHALLEADDMLRGEASAEAGI